MGNTSLFSLSTIALLHVSIDHNPEGILMYVIWIDFIYCQKTFLKQSNTPVFTCANNLKITSRYLYYSWGAKCELKKKKQSTKERDK